MKNYLVEIDGTEHNLPALRDGNKIWFHFKGQTYMHEVKAKNFDVKQKGQGDVRAFVSGQIQKVCVSLGEKVKQGDLILVMYAMKMEYSIKAEVDGIVDQLSVKEGEQVAADQLLASIKDEQKN